jgi:hypothetical protein
VQISGDRGDKLEKRRKIMNAWAAFATSDLGRFSDVIQFSSLVVEAKVPKSRR